MNARPASARWSRGRFWGMVGVFFALQAGLIALLAERGPKEVDLTPPGYFGLVWKPLTADDLAKTYFATDPAEFPLPGRHGFSEGAWLDMSESQYEAPAETEQPQWLSLNTAHLGANFPGLTRPESALPFGLADRYSADTEAWPAFLPAEQIRSNSVCEIGGALAARQLQLPGGLKAWPSVILLSNTVVQIAVNPAGQVIAARLQSRSGLADADNQALDKARRLRFRPAPSPEAVWGRVTFTWQTVEPTNSASVETQ